MSTGKPILGIETSGSICGTAVYFSDEKYFEVKIKSKNIHAEKIFETIDRVLISAGINLGDLGAVAVSSGPGSFTGLRIGMSAAKGIALGASLPLIAVPTFEALALQLSSILPENTVFAVANKVNMEEVYFARFQIKANTFIFVDELQVISRKSLENKVSGCIVFGNAVEGNKISAPDPLSVAKWGSLNEDRLVFDFDYLEPNYLKNFIISALVPNSGTGKE